MKLQMRGTGYLVLVATLVGSVGVGPANGAELSDLVLSIAAQTEGAGRGSGEILIYQEDGWWAGETFYWQAEDDLDITDPDTGEVLGTFMQSAIMSCVVPPEGSRSHPQISFGFAIQAGADVTTFTLQSALLSFGPYLNPMARASSGLTVSDANGDGALLSGATVFRYDDTPFYECIWDIEVTEPFGTEADDCDSGWLAIPGWVDEMSLEMTFTLTPGDFASGTGTFQIVPEPAAAVLLLAGATLVRRR